MTRPIYNRHGWILALCSLCGRSNYCEPHGTTASCICSDVWVEHAPVPQEWRSFDGFTALLPRRKYHRPALTV